MDAVSVNQFRAKLKEFVDRVIDTHDVLKITRRKGQDFVVISADDWERHQETLYILQNKYLMKQINKARENHKKGYQPSEKERDEIINL